MIIHFSKVDFLLVGNVYRLLNLEIRVAYYDCIGSSPLSFYYMDLENVRYVFKRVWWLVLVASLTQSETIQESQ